MKGIVLSVWKFDNGRLALRSDIPDNMTDEERAELIHTLRKGISKLRPNVAFAVNACIRELAFGAVLCSPNLPEAIRDFRDEAERLLENP